MKPATLYNYRDNTNEENPWFPKGFFRSNITNLCGFIIIFLEILFHHLRDCRLFRKLFLVL